MKAQGRHHRLGHPDGDVEGRLERRLSPPKRPRGAAAQRRQEQVLAGCEDQSEEQGDLAQGHDVGLAGVFEAQGDELADGEGGRQQNPGDLQRRPVVSQAPH